MGVPFDRIVSSSPLNKTAGTVASSKGDRYEPVVNFACHDHWDAPQPTRAPPVGMSGLIGRKFGRLTVIGYMGRANPKKSGRWLVRCTCGDYEARKAVAINNAENNEDCCRKCAHWKTVKKRLERDGSRPIEDFVS